MGESVSDHVREQAERTLAAYQVQPNLVREHVGIEDEVLSGGYGHRQIHELIQNAADAILESGSRGRVHVLLTQPALYCANEGAPIDVEGVTAILNSHISRKRGAQIGQFGLGFKSVLAISQRPEFHSRTVRFGFDAQWSEQQIRAVLPTVERTPVLRLARVLIASDCGDDEHLEKLIEWATTVVKLPRVFKDTSWISSDIEEFPREFLLFSPHVDTLTLEDGTNGRLREITAGTAGDRVVISEGEHTTTWDVFSREIPRQVLGADALLDADRKTRDRLALPLLWAVPHDARRARGQFWAFFPTETATTLTGIINAPWKTNADRQNLLDGPFNRALLWEAVHLVRDSMPTLFRADDPGYLLDVLPVRAADAAGWADEALIEALEPVLQTTACLPDSTGSLRTPSELKLRPEIVLASEFKDSAFQLHELPEDWVHPSVEKRERRAKAQRIGATVASLEQWLEALAMPPSPESSVRALIAAASIREELSPSLFYTLRQARIILTTAGNWVNAKSPGLVLPQENEADGDDTNGVHPLVASDAAAREALRTLEVPERTGLLLLNQLLAAYRVDWDQAWTHLRELSFPDAIAAIEKHGGSSRLLVKTLAGEYKPLPKTLLAGAIVPASGERDSAVCIDSRFHSDDIPLLRAIGATESPVMGRDERSSTWYHEYVQAAQKEFYRGLQTSSRPDAKYLSFGKRDTAGPLDPLTSLSEEGRRLMTQALVAFLPGEQEWVFGHKTRADTYPPMNYQPPIRWMVRRSGRLSTSLGLKRVAEAVTSALDAWNQFLPVAAIDPRSASLLDLPDSPEALDSSHWATAMDRAQQVADERLIGSFYGLAARFIPAPASLWCREGDQTVAHPPAAIHLACDADTAQAHRIARVPSVVAPDRETLQLLAERWGMQKSAGIVRYIAAADQSPVVDALPGLRRYLPETVWNTPLQPCEQIWFEPTAKDAGAAVPLRFARVDDRLCFVTALSSLELIRHVAAELGVTLAGDELQDAEEYARRADRQRLVSQIKQIADAATKLATLMGAGQLLNGLPAGVQAVLVDREEHDSSQHVAQAALAVYGVEVLRHFAGVLAEKGLEPPSRWSGSPRAQEFVDELGFGAEYAGFQSIRRDPAVDVDGPVLLKPLHSFQQSIATRIQGFLQKQPPERGLLSLPTGSGKTRVVVQAVVESIKQGEFKGPLIWIAQSDELCEQAVHSWTQAWRAFGPAGRLRVSRLWGQTNNRVVEAQAPHIVVTTYQSLVSRLPQRGYRWILDAQCLVIDEAHGSIAPSYTEILSAFELTAHKTSRPLIGLTATPFRSSEDPAETQWLVNRYGRQRFDHDVLPGDDPYGVLQRMGILAKVDQQILEGADLQLSDVELAGLTQFKRLPATAEFRLGESAPRNKRLVDSIKALPQDWPVLLFATSVEQAHLMAALLSMEGVSAKAISGELDQGVRRHYIEEFRRGRIRVLSNYNVLSTGFDAPALRALYIARPVYSPVLYQQMLGRGLRGPLNGGKERCLVVNVQDNVAQFGEKLAFHHFEYLWKGEPAS